MFSVGDRVIKNPDTWIASEFDAWGAGVGVGLVVEPPFELIDTVDVRWPFGRCFQEVEELLPAPPDHDREVLIESDGRVTEYDGTPIVIPAQYDGVQSAKLLYSRVHHNGILRVHGPDAPFVLTMR